MGHFLENIHVHELRQQDQGFQGVVGGEYCGCKRRLGRSPKPFEGHGECKDLIASIEGKLTNGHLYFYVCLYISFLILRTCVHIHMAVLTLICGFASVLRCDGGQILLHQHEIDNHQISPRAQG